METVFILCNRQSSSCPRSFSWGFDTAVSMNLRYALVLLQSPPGGGLTITGIASIIIKISKLALHKNKWGEPGAPNGTVFIVLTLAEPYHGGALPCT